MPPIQTGWQQGERLKTVSSGFLPDPTPAHVIVCSHLATAHVTSQQNSPFTDAPCEPTCRNNRVIAEVLPALRWVPRISARPLTAQVDGPYPVKKPVIFWRPLAQSNVFPGAKGFLIGSKHLGRLTIIGFKTLCIVEVVTVNRTRLASGVVLKVFMAESIRPSSALALAPGLARR